MDIDVLVPIILVALTLIAGVAKHLTGLKEDAEKRREWREETSFDDLPEATRRMLVGSNRPAQPSSEPRQAKPVGQTAIGMEMLPAERSGTEAPPRPQPQPQPRPMDPLEILLQEVQRRMSGAPAAPTPTPGPVVVQARPAAPQTAQRAPMPSRQAAPPQQAQPQRVAPQVQARVAPPAAAPRAQQAPARSGAQQGLRSPVQTPRSPAQTPRSPAQTPRAQGPRATGQAPAKRRCKKARQLLGGRMDLRRAVLLSEVLGPPLALRAPFGGATQNGISSMGGLG